MGLLLPAVQQARESGRRSLCVNNLKQIALGIHNFHDANNKFPVAFKATDAYKSGVTDATYGQGISWVAYVLPFIEQSALHSQINFNIASITTSSDPNASLAVSRRVSELYCPSLATLADVRQAGSATPASAAQTMNYFGVMGIVVPSSLAETYPKYLLGEIAWSGMGKQGSFNVLSYSLATTAGDRGSSSTPREISTIPGQTIFRRRKSPVA